MDIALRCGMKNWGRKGAGRGERLHKTICKTNTVIETKVNRKTPSVGTEIKQNDVNACVMRCTRPLTD